MVNASSSTVGSKTLDNGLRVLAAVAARPAGATATELARAVGLDRTVTYRLLRTLVAHEFVTQDVTSYRLGLAVTALARNVRADLRSVAREPLRGLAQATGATAHLTVLDGDEAVSVSVVEPESAAIHVAYRVGLRHPLDRGAAGMAIVLGRPPLAGERTRVRRARRLGYVSSSGEIQAGAWGLAAPVPAPDGGPATASVGVVALRRLDESAVSTHVLAAAATIGERCGG